MKTRLLVLFGLLLLMTAAASAGTTCAAASVVPVNGGSTDFDFVAPGGTNFYEVNVKPGRSYSVEVLQPYDDQNNDLTVTVFSDTACTAAVTTTNTTAAEPAVPHNAFRGSFITGSTVSNPSYRIAVVHGNAAGTGRYIRVTAAETTLFTPLYTTFSGFNTFYRVFNTTSQSVTGTLTAVGPTGAAIGTPVTVTVAPYSSSLTIYTGVTVPNADLGLTVPKSNAGPAFFVHNGPPGGVIIDGFSSNGTSVLPIKFVSVREIR